MVHKHRVLYAGEAAVWNVDCNDSRLHHLRLCVHESVAGGLKCKDRETDILAPHHSCLRSDHRPGQRLLLPRHRMPGPLLRALKHLPRDQRASEAPDCERLHSHESMCLLRELHLRANNRFPHSSVLSLLVNHYFRTLRRMDSVPLHGVYSGAGDPDDSFELLLV